MQIVHSIQLHSGTNEENLPGFTPEFPYIASRAELDHYRDFFVPWHWHKAVELFYMESGEIRYHTPNGTAIFPADSGGMVNSNVLHMTEMLSRTEKNIQYLHIFDPALIAGAYGSLIGEKYVTPFISASQLELIRLTPDEPEQAEILAMIRQAFRLDENEFGYEIRLREALSQIWLKLLKVSSSALQSEAASDRKTDDKIKTIMIYIRDHISEKISVRDLANSAFLSERECYRVFQSCLHTTPTEYVTSCRMQMACRMLAETRESVTAVGHACGLGSSSYFGKTFKEHTGYTPLEYRRKWQDNDII